MRTKFTTSNRRGSIYIAVLGVSLIVTTLAVGGIMTGRVLARASSAESDLADARYSALSGVELAKLWISQDTNWRTTRSNGDWATDLAIGNGTVTINVVDPVDGVLSNRPNDPVTITVTGKKGLARHVTRTKLSPSAIPMTCLAYAMHAPGLVRVRTACRISAGSATISTNGSLRNDSTIEGAALAGSVTTAGIVFGGITTGGTARETPTSTVADLYAAMGTEISPGSTINKVAIGPGINPYGTANSDGIYVVRSSSDVTITNCRIAGTLVVICPGYKVTLTGDVVMEPGRAGYPALIVVGELLVQCSGNDRSLSEATWSTNFNPAGAPSNGVTDSDKTDTYPCEINGLVFATGKIDFKSTASFKGALISGLNSSSEACDVEANITIKYDSSLYTNPPPGFTSSVPMVPLAGSFEPVVN